MTTRSSVPVFSIVCLGVDTANSTFGRTKSGFARVSTHRRAVLVAPDELRAREHVHHRRGEVRVQRRHLARDDRRLKDADLIVLEDDLVVVRRDGDSIELIEGHIRTPHRSATLALAAQRLPKGPAPLGRDDRPPRSSFVNVHLTGDGLEPFG